MIDLYQPSSYLKKLFVKKSDEIFAPSDPLSIPFYPVLCSWSLSCLDCIKAPLSSGLQLCMKNGEHQQVRGWEEQEAGILIHWPNPSIEGHSYSQTAHSIRLGPNSHSLPLLLQAQTWQQLLNTTTSRVMHSPFLIP